MPERPEGCFAQMGPDPIFAQPIDTAMPQTTDDARAIFQQLKPGDRVEVEHQVTVGTKSWPAKASGTVLGTERRRHGLHFARNHDDKVFSDVIRLELPGGELSEVTLDEFTVIRRS